MSIVAVGRRCEAFVIIACAMFSSDMQQYICCICILDGRTIPQHDQSGAKIHRTKWIFGVHHMHIFRSKSQIGISSAFCLRCAAYVCVCVVRNDKCMHEAHKFSHVCARMAFIFGKLELNVASTPLQRKNN